MNFNSQMLKISRNIVTKRDSNLLNTLNFLIIVSMMNVKFSLMPLKVIAYRSVKMFDKDAFGIGTILSQMHSFVTIHGFS